jgi:CRP/FNR family cyclic AMP-dependent transcriptional regulator
MRLFAHGDVEDPMEDSNSDLGPPGVRLERADRSIMAALAANPVFRPLSEPARAKLAAASVRLCLEPGAVLFNAGDAGDAVYIIIEGEVEIRTGFSSGREVRFVTLGAGAIVGEMAALDGGPRSADVAATRRTQLSRIPRALLFEALEAEPKAAVALIGELSRRIRVANSAMEAKVILDLGGRLAQFLLDAQNRVGTISMTQTEMARRLGVSREKVNRKLHQWVDLGWIALLPFGVRIVEASSLRKAVEISRTR